MEPLSNSEGPTTDEDSFDEALQLLQDCGNLPSTVFLLADNEMSNGGLKRQTFDTTVPEERINKKQKAT